MKLSNWLKRHFDFVVPQVESVPQSFVDDVFVATAKQLSAGGHVSPLHLVEFLRMACMHYLNRTYHLRDLSTVRIAVKAVVNEINSEK